MMWVPRPTVDRTPNMTPRHWVLIRSAQMTLLSRPIAAPPIARLSAFGVIQCTVAWLTDGYGHRADDVGSYSWGEGDNDEANHIEYQCDEVDPSSGEDVGEFRKDCSRHKISNERW